jgi:hypothetical protein
MKRKKKGDLVDGILGRVAGASGALPSSTPTPPKPETGARRSISVDGATGALARRLVLALVPREGRVLPLGELVARALEFYREKHSLELPEDGGQLRPGPRRGRK